MKRILQGVARRLFAYDDGTIPMETAKNMRVMIFSVMIGTFCYNVTGGAAFTGYIKSLGASDLVLSILVAMPFVMRFLMIFASYILERTKARKGMFIFMGILSRALWLPIALVPFLIPMEMTALRVWMILVFYAMVACTGIFLDTSFLSMAADVVPMRLRGRFFSVRSRIMMVLGIAAGLIIGFILDNVKGNDGLLGYIICFTFAALFGIGDIICYIRMPFPPMEEGEATRAGAKKPSLPIMLREVFANKPFMKLVVYWTVWSFSCNIMAPFFNVYMLEHIGMSFVEITLFCTIPANAMAVFLLKRWGGAMDTHGYKPVLYICTTILSISPILWLFCGPRFFIFVLLGQILSGAVGPAIDLCAQNTIMNKAPTRNRSMYTAVHSVITQLCGVAVGFVAGGFLLDNVFAPLVSVLTGAGITLFGLPLTQYHFLLVVTALLRFLSTFVLRKTDMEGSIGAMELVRTISLNTVNAMQRRIFLVRAQILRRRYRKNHL